MFGIWPYVGICKPTKRYDKEKVLDMTFFWQLWLIEIEIMKVILLRFFFEKQYNYILVSMVFIRKTTVIFFRIFPPIFQVFCSSFVFLLKWFETIIFFLQYIFIVIEKLLNVK